MQGAPHPVFAMLEMYVPVFHKNHRIFWVRRAHKDHWVQTWISYQNLPSTKMAKLAVSRKGVVSREKEQWDTYSLNITSTDS